MRGSVSGAGYIDKIRIGSDALFNELAEQRASFEHNVNLIEGTNQIPLRISDLAGNVTTTTIVCVADFHPPSLYFEGTAQADEDDPLVLMCRDDHALALVKVNDHVVFSAPSEVSPFAVRRVAVPLPEEDTAMLYAEDLAGNACDVQLTREHLEALRPVSAAEAHEGLLHGPDLHLERTGSLFQVLSDEFFIDGWVRDRRGVRRVRVNTHDQLTGKRESEVVYFSTRVPLALGTNDLVVTAENTDGSTTSRRFKVVRMLPEHERQALRLCAEMVPFRAATTETGARALQIMLRDALLQDPVRFYVLDRAGGYAAAQNERMLSRTPLSDPRSRLRPREVLQPDLLLEGWVLDERDGRTVAVDVVDAEDGTALFIEDVFVENGADASALDLQLRGLALKLSQRFPIVSGEVVAVRGNHVSLNVGERDGVIRGSKFVVMQVSSRSLDARTMHVRKYRGRFIQLQVDTLEPWTSSANVVPSKAKPLIRKGDAVYAR